MSNNEPEPWWRNKAVLGATFAVGYVAGTSLNRQLWKQECRERERLERVQKERRAPGILGNIFNLLGQSDSPSDGPPPGSKPASS